MAGSWVLAHEPGLLWTPGYWSDGGWGGYAWHAGYWSPHVGFYGGINYGFGYFGLGFQGGYWHDRTFYYNLAVTHITNWHITNVYNQTIVKNQFSNSRLSFNGPHGVHARPIAMELVAASEPHCELAEAPRHATRAASQVRVNPHSTTSASRYAFKYPSSRMTARPAPVPFGAPQRKFTMSIKASVHEPRVQSAKATPRYSPVNPAVFNWPKPIEQEVHRELPARTTLKQTRPRAFTAQATPNAYREPAWHMDLSAPGHAHRKA